MQPGLSNVGIGRTSFLFQINVTRRLLALMEN